MTWLALVLASCPLVQDTDLEFAQADTVCALQGRAQPGGVADRGALEALYARPEFATSHSSATGDLFKRLKAWLEELFETSGAETFSNVTRVAVLVLAATLVVGVLVKLSGRRARRPRGTPREEATRLELADPAEHLARAATVVSADPRLAAREGLFAILAALERQRLARPDRVKTNRELARELPDRGAPPALVAAVSAQLAWYDRAFYSLEPLAPERARAFLDEARGLVAQVTAFGAGATR